MHPVADLFYEKAIASLPTALRGMLIGLLGFAVIGFAYCYGIRKREGRDTSFQSLLSAVFPRDMYRCPTARVDIYNYFITTLVVLPAGLIVVALLSLALGSDFSQMLTSVFGRRQPILSAIWPLAIIQATSTFLGVELGEYVWHRAEHEIPLLWSIHRAHHSAERLNFFTNARDHPLEVIFLVSFKALGASITTGSVLYATGTRYLPQSTSLLIFVTAYIMGFYFALSHSHMRIAFGNRFNIVLGGPVMHQIHHSAEVHMRNKNYGLATYVFDWLFGTLYLPRRDEEIRVGLNDVECEERNPHLTLREFYIEPVRNVIRVLRRQPTSFYQGRLPRGPRASSMGAQQRKS